MYALKFLTSYVLHMRVRRGGPWTPWTRPESATESPARPLLKLQDIGSIGVVLRACVQPTTLPPPRFKFRPHSGATEEGEQGEQLLPQIYQ